MTPILLSLALAAAAGPATTMPLPAGGWASISVEKLPDQITVGKSLDIVFVVKQHGQTPLSGLKPTLEIKGGATMPRVAAEPAREKGQYKAAVVLTQAGDYFITIHSGFGDSRLTLPAIKAVTVTTGTDTR
jgi:hypothetical protein